MFYVAMAYTAEKSLLNVQNLLTSNAASHPRRPEPS
jgi:hypothetical protein